MQTKENTDKQTSILTAEATSSLRPHSNIIDPALNIHSKLTKKIIIIHCSITSYGTFRSEKEKSSGRRKRTGEAEALLLPVGVLVDLGAQDLLHEVLRIGAVHAPRGRVRAVGHGHIRAARREGETLALAMAAELQLPLQQVGDEHKEPPQA
jgi:hypothetical protein